MIPKKFFVTGAKATSPVSKLNAFDLALKNAGIAQCNLVQVSSILPPGCVEEELRDLPAGSIVFSVVARMDGDEGATIGAGVSWAWERQRRFGIVAESHGHFDERSLKEILTRKILEMAEIRDIKIDAPKVKVEAMRVPKGKFGCVFAALVFSP
jgi:arginine decarboxylase